MEKDKGFSSVNCIKCTESANYYYFYYMTLKRHHACKKNKKTWWKLSALRQVRMVMKHVTGMSLHHIYVCHGV